MRGVDVAVIGGGAVGVCSALELARQGATVALLERGADLAWGCSAGNAGIVGPSHVLPLASPAAVRDGMRWMSRPDSPFYVRPNPATRAAVERTLPTLGKRRTLEVWRGLRPCTPDGLPVIARPPEIENVALAAGHGMWGLQLAPVTALLVAQLIAGRTPSHDLDPLRAERFGLPARPRRRQTTTVMAGQA